MLFYYGTTKGGDFWAAVSMLNVDNPFEKGKDDKKLITVLQVLEGLWCSPIS